MTEGASSFQGLQAVYALSAAVMAALCATMWLAWRELRSTSPALGRFATGFGLMFVGMGLLAAWGRLPDFLAVVLGNLALMAGAAAVFEGSREFGGRPANRLATLVTTGLSVVLFPLFVYVWPSVALRVVASSAMLAALLGGAAVTTWRDGRRRTSGPLALWAAAALAADTLMVGARAVLTLAGGEATAEAFTTPALAVGLVSGVCWTVAVVLMASRRFEGELLSQKELFAKLLAAARAGAEGLALDSTLETVLEAAQGLAGATGSSLLLFGEDGGFTRGLFTEGDATTMVDAAVARSLLRDGLAGWVSQERQSVIVPDVSKDPRWLRVPNQDASVRAALCVPIATGPTLVGVLTLVHDERDFFKDGHCRLVESVAAQIALVLRNAQVTSERMRVARQHALLNEVLGAAARQLGADEIAATAAAAIARGTGWTNVVVAVTGDDGWLRFLGGHPALAEARQPTRQGVVGRAFATGDTQVVPDVEKDPDYFAYAPGVRSELAVPLKHGTRVLGVLNLESDARDAFGTDDVRLAEALAGAIGLGLDNARLLRVREELTRALVHDLRSPLVSITGSLRLLARLPGLGPGDQKLIEIAERNSARLASLINSILEVSRLEDGAAPITRARVPLHEVVGEALRLAAPGAASRDVRLAGEDAAAPLADAWVDRGLIARVLQNLLDNAIKFSAAGAAVTVSLTPDADGVAVRVRDSGPGVDEKARSRLFQNFAPGGQAASGSGLGLAFCRLAVEANGGRIWLEDTPGGGATFAVALPAAPEPESGARTGAS